MNHPTEDALLEILDGRGLSEDVRHIETCLDCSQELEEWSLLANDTSLFAECELDSREMHMLQAQFRALGPVRQGFADLVARLLHSTTARPAAVRGGASPAFEEHQAGTYHVAMQARAPGPHTQASIHGQIFNTEDAVESGEVVLSNDHGDLVSEEIDELGEFSVRMPRAGHYRVTILLAQSRITIEDLEIAGRDPE